jgi:hypothetical protein
MAPAIRVAPDAPAPAENARTASASLYAGTPPAHSPAPTVHAAPDDSASAVVSPRLPACDSPFLRWR